MTKLLTLELKVEKDVGYWGNTIYKTNLSLSYLNVYLLVNHQYINPQYCQSIERLEFNAFNQNEIKLIVDLYC